jgi:hypothetical protein
LKSPVGATTTSAGTASVETAVRMRPTLLPAKITL